MIDSCVCRIFLEPQHVPALAETVAAGTSAVSALPNLLGANLMPGSELYYRLMEGITGSLVRCWQFSKRRR